MDRRRVDGVSDAVRLRVFHAAYRQARSHHLNHVGHLDHVVTEAEQARDESPHPGAPYPRKRGKPQRRRAIVGQRACPAE